MPEIVYCYTCNRSQPVDVNPLRGGWRTYASIAAELASTVERKQAAYGDSFGKSGAIMAILYPAGVPVEHLDDALTVVRVLDKLFRIATDRDALGESPWHDVAGYALLAVRRVEQDKAPSSAT